MSAVTYTPAGNLNGPTFTCSRCKRVYSYPHDHGAPIRCECGWWYYNLGHGRITETFRPRIGGDEEPRPAVTAEPPVDEHAG